jgi:hypothetical protein
MYIEHRFAHALPATPWRPSRSWISERSVLHGPADEPLCRSCQLPYTTRMGRLRSYVNWPHSCSNLSPAALSNAGFFHSCNRRQTFSHTLILLNCIQYPTLFNLTYRSGRWELMFSLWRGLRFWQMTDDPWKEHALWFPFCVFLRYVKGTEFVCQCENSQKAITSTTDSNDGKQCTLM